MEILITANQSIACTNAEIEKGRGGEVFPPTKDKGTRGGD